MPKHQIYLFSALFAAFLCLVAPLPSAVHAWPWSKGRLAGTVYDQNDPAHGLEGVRVTVEENGISCLSDRTGAFSMGEIPPGIYRLSLEKPGFRKKTRSVQVTADRTTVLKFGLLNGERILGLLKWTGLSTAELLTALRENGPPEQRIAVVFYMKSGVETCELPDLALKFGHALNAQLGKADPMHVVVRDATQTGYISKELSAQLQNTERFEPNTLAALGEELGANIVVTGALFERREYIDPVISALSVPTAAYIKGVSCRYLLKRGEAGCRQGS